MPAPEPSRLVEKSPDDRPLPEYGTGELRTALARGKLRQANAQAYRNAQPFPHVVIDDFLPKFAFETLTEKLPLPTHWRFPKLIWDDYDAKTENNRIAQYRKESLSKTLFMDPFVRQLIFELSAGPFLEELEHLTGIRGLLPDPKLLGGGVHVVHRGGVLGIHADFNAHPDYLLDRRVNLLLYLNREWKEEYGGHLELWSRDMAQCERSLLPIGNRCVIFNTDQTSFHGHPKPLNCPHGMMRESIALYYYTIREEGDREGATSETLWQELPESGS